MLARARLPCKKLSRKMRCCGKLAGDQWSPLHLRNIFYHAATAHVPGTVKTVPYKAPVNPICREGS